MNAWECTKCLHQYDRKTSNLQPDVTLQGTRKTRTNQIQARRRKEVARITAELNIIEIIKNLYKGSM